MLLNGTATRAPPVYAIMKTESAAGEATKDQAADQTPAAVFVSILHAAKPALSIRRATRNKSASVEAVTMYVFCLQKCSLRHEIELAMQRHYHKKISSPARIAKISARTHYNITYQLLANSHQSPPNRNRYKLSKAL